MSRNSYNAGCLYTQCHRDQYKGGGGMTFVLTMVLLALIGVGAAAYFLA